MALNSMGLGFMFTAKDLASGVMHKVQGAYNNLADATTKKSTLMRSAFSAIGPGLAAVGIGLGGIAAGFALANDFGEFEQGLAGVRSVMRASDKDFAMLREAALNAGIATQFSPTEAVSGLEQLATAGQTATEAVKTLIPVLDLSAGSLGTLGVAGAAQAVIGTLNSYSLTADHASDVTDRLLRITELTNFQARDFEGGLAKAAAAGGIFDQSLNDVLITMGLLRNRNIDASSSSTAYREALRRLATDAHAAKAATAAGVDIYDKGTGKLRELVDITQDFADKTSRMTEKQRNHLVVQAYGARGLLTFAAIQKAQVTATENGITTTYKGADAIAHLRQTMAETSGTASRFREALLNTFQGQKTLLHGSMMTLGIVAGEGFAGVFKPVVSAVIFGVNVLIRVIKSTPTPVKQFFAALWLATSAFFALAGAAVLTVSAVTLLLPAIKIVALGFAGAAVAAAPLLLVVGALALAFVALRIAYQENIGGIGDTTNRMASGISLAFQGISQLFSQGGFSGAVRLEMQKAENEGIRNFAIAVYVWGERIKNFFVGIATGFREALQDNDGTFTEFRKSLDLLASAFNRLFDSSLDVDSNRDKWMSWGEAGGKTGFKLGQAAALIVRGLTWVVDTVTSAMNAWTRFTDTLGTSEAIEGVTWGFRHMSQEIDKFSDRMDTSSQKGQEWSSSWSTGIHAVFFEVRLLGAIFGFVFNIVGVGVGLITTVIDNLQAMVWGTIELVRGLLTGDGARAWGGFKMIAFGAIMAVKGAAMALALTLASVIDMMANMAGGGEHISAVGKLHELDDSLTKKLTGSLGVTLDAKGNPVMTPEGKSETPVIDGLLARRPGQNGDDSGVTADLAKTLPDVAGAQSAKDQFAQFQASNAEFLKLLGAQPINVTSTTTLMLDEDKLATAVTKARRKRNATGFDSGADAQE